MERQKILIVDDSEMNLALLVDILEEQYDVVEAANGVEAISILSKQRTDFSLLLLDRRSRDTLGLKGDEIPIAAQVVALADVYDAFFFYPPASLLPDIPCSFP